MNKNILKFKAAFALGYSGGSWEKTSADFYLDLPENLDTEGIAAAEKEVVEKIQKDLSLEKNIVFVKYLSGGLHE